MTKSNVIAFNQNTDTKLTLFNFKDHEVRVVEIDGEPWFVAVDVCRALDMDVSRGVHRWVHRLDAAERRTITRNDTHALFVGVRVPSYSLISESGLYKLVMRSDKPEARAFQDWVTKEVLPAIRKDGAYIMGEEKVRTGEMSEDQLVLRAVEILQDKVARLTNERDDAQATIREHLLLLTVDEWRALSHVYLTRNEKVRMGMQASAFAGLKNSDPSGNPVDGTLLALNAAWSTGEVPIRSEACPREANQFGRKRRHSLPV